MWIWVLEIIISAILLIEERDPSLLRAYSHRSERANHSKFDFIPYFQSSKVSKLQFRIIWPECMQNCEWVSWMLSVCWRSSLELFTELLSFQSKFDRYFILNAFVFIWIWPFVHYCPQAMANKWNSMKYDNYYFISISRWIPCRLRRARHSSMGFATF